MQRAYGPSALQVHGLSTAMPVPAKSFSLRVTSVRSQWSAVAAIRRSSSPALFLVPNAPLRTRAQAGTRSSSAGKMRPRKRTTSALNQTLSFWRRVPDGSRSMPVRISAIVTTLRDSAPGGVCFSHAASPVFGAACRPSEITHVSSKKRFTERAARASGSCALGFQRARGTTEAGRGYSYRRRARRSYAAR